MTTDPQSEAIERVAPEFPMEKLSAILVEGREKSQMAAVVVARMIAEYDHWLTEQGIPIDRLLSGEWVAVPRNPDWRQEKRSLTGSIGEPPESP